MTRHPTMRLLALSFLMVAGRAFAQDDEVVDVAPCPFMCAVWRNVSGTVPPAVVPPNVAQTGGSEPSETPTLRAEDGVGVPKSSDLAVSPGRIIVDTPADRALRERQRARLLRDTTVQVDRKGHPILR